MSATTKINKRANLKQKTNADLPINPAQPVTFEHIGVTTLGQTIINLPFAVDQSNTKNFLLIIDGKTLTEGASNDYQFTAIQSNNTSSQVTLAVAQDADLNIRALYLGVVLPSAGSTSVLNLQAQVNALEAVQLQTKLAAFTADVLYDAYFCSASGGAYIVSLPTAVGNLGKEFFFKKIDTSANAITIDGNGAELVGENITIQLAAMNDYVRIVSDGTNWVIVDANTTSEVRLHTSNGRGSTNTAIRRYLTPVKNIGTGVTYTDSATDGASFLINESGKYAISVSNGAREVNDTMYSGISLNSNELTLDITTIAPAARLAAQVLSANFGAGAIGASSIANAKWEGYLAKGDVIRSHGTSNDPDNAPLSAFTISKVG